MATAIVNGSGLRVRSRPAAAGADAGHILGRLEAGDVVRVKRRGLGVDGKWVEVALFPDPARTDRVLSGFVYGTWLDDPPPALGTQPASRLLGVHELNDKSKAFAAVERGAGAVMVFEGAMEAHQLSLQHPHLVVMHRKYFRDAPAPRDMIAWHGVNPDERGNPSRAWYRGINEMDSPGFDGSPDGILKRARWDVECALTLKQAAPNATWVGGGFPHGCPDFTQPAVCAAVRAGYADAYNSGLMAFDIHTYSKAGPNGTRDYRYYAPIWFEARWRFLFTHCGFDPRVQRVVSSETGAELGAGGHAWAGYSEDEFKTWADYWLAICREPLDVSGTQFTSPFLAATYFQWGDTNHGSGGWAGYSAEPYVGAMARLWRDLPRGLTTSRVDVLAGAEPAHSAVPAPKVMP